MPIYEFYKELRRYGAIKDVWGNIGDFNFNMIHSDTVNNLKSLKFLSINGISVPIQHEKDVSTIKSCQPNVFDKLNNDCIYELFDYLNFGDIVELSKISVRLNILASHRLRCRYKDQIPTEFHTADYTEYHNNDYTCLYAIENDLRQFGDLIKTADVDNYGYSARLQMALITEYCPNVENLVCNVGGSTSSWAEFDPILTKLQMTLKTLIIVGLTTNISLPRVKLPNLFSLTLQNVRIANDVSTVRFFQLNAQLRVLAFHKNVEIVNNVLVPITHLHNLKSFIIHSTMQSVILKCIKLFNRAEIALEQIGIIGIAYSSMRKGLFNAIGNCKQLKTLTIDELTVAPIMRARTINWTKMIQAITHFEHDPVVIVENTQIEIVFQLTRRNNAWIKSTGVSHADIERNIVYGE